MIQLKHICNELGWGLPCAFFCLSAYSRSFVNKARVAADQCDLEEAPKKTKSIWSNLSTRPGVIDSKIVLRNEHLVRLIEIISHQEFDHS